MRRRSIVHKYLARTMGRHCLEETSDPVFCGAGLLISSHIVTGFHPQHIFDRHFFQPWMHFSRKIFRKILTDFIFQTNHTIRHQKSNSKRSIAFCLRKHPMQFFLIIRLIIGFHYHMTMPGHQNTVNRYFLFF